MPRGWRAADEFGSLGRFDGRVDGGSVFGGEPELLRQGLQGRALFRGELAIGGEGGDGFAVDGEFGLECGPGLRLLVDDTPGLEGGERVGGRTDGFELAFGVVGNRGGKGFETETDECPEHLFLVGIGTGVIQYLIEGLLQGGIGGGWGGGWGGGCGGGSGVRSGHGGHQLVGDNDLRSGHRRGSRNGSGSGVGRDRLDWDRLGNDGRRLRLGDDRHGGG